LVAVVWIELSLSVAAHPAAEKVGCAAAQDDVSWVHSVQVFSAVWMALAAQPVAAPTHWVLPAVAGSSPAVLVMPVSHATHRLSWTRKFVLQVAETEPAANVYASGTALLCTHVPQLEAPVPKVRVPVLVVPYGHAVHTLASLPAVLSPAVWM